MSTWTIQKARETYNIAHWSDGYFDISENGHVVAHPQGQANTPAIDLPQLVETIQAAGLALPVLVRFTNILKSRLDRLQNAFAKAMQVNGYQGGYCSVYPIKVNQQRHVVEELVGYGGERVGLEAGSKPELLAVLALLAGSSSTVICNGYKDREYIRLALIGQQLGHQVYIIVEKLSELELILEESVKLNITPRLGIRVRLASIGAGKWQNTGGEKSKFGLSAAQVLKAVERLVQAGYLDSLQLVHCHLGSQIANIRDIQRGMRECARYFAELRHMNVPIQCVDVGGGLGIDYEGTRSRSFCSMNYSMEEYANNVVHILKEVCQEKNLTPPRIITESGRAMTAHHAMLVLNVIDNEQANQTNDVIAVSAEEPAVIRNLWTSLQNLSDRSVLEVYHDICYELSEAQAQFTLGILNLAQRARAEQLYLLTCLQIRELLQLNHRAHRELLEELTEKLADKLFVNFSLFQSLPDIWALDQIFPVMPLMGLRERPTQRAVLQDITCDSDGRIDFYIDGQGVQATLPLPPYQEDTPYWLGVFLVGAYQEILGDMHNLFGDTNSVHVELKADGQYQLVQPLYGDTVADVLRYVHFEPEELLQSYRRQLQNSALPENLRAQYFSELSAGLEGYTYLED